MTLRCGGRCFRMVSFDSLKASVSQNCYMSNFTETEDCACVVHARKKKGKAFVWIGQNHHRTQQPTCLSRHWIINSLRLTCRNVIKSTSTMITDKNGISWDHLLFQFPIPSVIPCNTHESSSMVFRDLVRSNHGTMVQNQWLRPYLLSPEPAHKYLTKVQFMLTSQIVCKVSVSETCDWDYYLCD